MSLVRARWSQLPLAVTIALALIVGCRGDEGSESPRGEPAGKVAQPLAVSGNFADFIIPPTVVPNNNNHGRSYGFSVFWMLGPSGTPAASSSFVPTMTIGGGQQVPCKETPQSSSCNTQAANSYCRCDVETVMPSSPITYTVHYDANGTNTENATFTATTTTGGTLAPAGQNSSFSFLFFSDPHGHLEDMPLMQQVAAAMAAEPNVKFGVGGGDMGEFGDPWYLYLTATYGATNSAGLLSTVPFYMAVGNHDWWGDPTDLCQFVGNWECDPGWPRLLLLQGGDLGGNRPSYGNLTAGLTGWEYRTFSFDYGNSHFTVLDTGLHSRFDVGGTWVQGSGWWGSYDLDTAQLQWAHDDLINASNNPQILHKFVVLHEPPYDTQGDMKELIANPDEKLDNSYPILEGLMKETGVEMVLAGHRHHYEHLQANGIHYVTCSGSANVDSGTSADDDSDAQVLGYVGNSAGYCRIDVNGPTITVSRQQVESAVDSNGPVTIPAQTVDTFTLGPPVPQVTAVNLDTSDLTNAFTVWWLDDSNHEASYEITRSLDPSFQDASTQVIANPTDKHGGLFMGLLSYVDEGPYTAGLPPNTTVYYRVRGWYPASNEFSAPSVGSATTPKAMVAVTGLKATATASGVQLTWSSSSNANYYEVERMGCSPHVTCTSTSCPAPPSYVCGYMTVNPQPIPGSPPASWPAPTSYLDANPTCANLSYRVRAWLSPLLSSEWSDPVTVDATQLACGPVIQRIGGVSPSAIRVGWSNDVPPGALYGGQVSLQSSPDGTKWSTVASSTASTTAGTDYQLHVPSSCGSASTSAYYRVVNYDANGGAHASPALLARPSRCMGTPTITAVPGGNTLAFQVTYAAPSGTPAPDAWVVYRRITGEQAFGTGRRFKTVGGSMTFTESDPDVTCESSFDYQVRGFYSGGTSYFPDGAPTELSNIVTVRPSCGACANGAAADQIFSPGMVGCGGAVTWDQRNSLCAPGYGACTAAEWAANASVAPTDDYWTDDNLGYLPGPNGGAAGCQAEARGGYACPTNEPMRVCTSTGTDRYHNACNWTGCGLNGSASGTFGGCYGNATAATLCCRRASACGPNATSTQTFAPGVAGCAGHVTWPARDGLCGKGCRACTAAEYQTYSRSATPAHDYWTNDNLGYSGTGSNACGASPGGASCGANTPMRVCTPSGRDSEGNVCNWTGCTLSLPPASGASGTANPYFGGCVGDEYAGTACCCDR